MQCRKATCIARLAPEGPSNMTGGSCGQGERGSVSRNAGPALVVVWYALWCGWWAGWKERIGGACRLAWAFVSLCG